MPRKRTVAPVPGINGIYDRHGVLKYWRHRASGKMLKCDPHTAEGVLEVINLDKQKPTANETSLADIIKAFRFGDDGEGCSKWKTYSDNTRAMYIRDFDDLEAIAEETFVNHMAEGDPQQIIDDAAEQRGIRAAQLLRDHLNSMLTWARSQKKLRVRVNPWKDTIAPKWAGKRGRRVNRALGADEVIAIFEDARDAPGYRAWLALHFLGGTRGGDARRITRKQYKNGRIYGQTEKNVEDLGIAVGPFFAAILDEAIKTAPDAVTIATSEIKRPFTRSGINGAWDRRRKRLMKAGKLRPGATPHGLRRALVGIARVHFNASDFAAAAAINNRSEKTAAIYGRDAERIETGNRIREQVAEMLFGVDIGPQGDVNEDETSTGMKNGMKNSEVIPLSVGRKTE